MVPSRVLGANLGQNLPGPMSLLAKLEATCSDAMKCGDWVLLLRKGFFDSLRLKAPRLKPDALLCDQVAPAWSSRLARVRATGMIVSP